MTFSAADRKDNETEGAEILSSTGWKRALGCRYAQLCKHCRANAMTCRDDIEASTYCGTYELFHNFKPSKMDTISH